MYDTNHVINSLIIHQTNIPFLLNVLDHQKFTSGAVDTYFIDEHPQLFSLKPSLNRAQKLLNYLGTVLVNGPQTPLATQLKPAEVSPHVPALPLGMFHHNPMYLTNFKMCVLFHFRVVN